MELARQLWLRKQEPFESIQDDYMRDLADDGREELDKCLGMFNLDQLLGALFEFIEVHVKQITTADEVDIR